MKWTAILARERILMKQIMEEECKDLFRESDVVEDIRERGIEQRVHEARRYVMQHGTEKELILISVSKSLLKEQQEASGFTIIGNL